MIIKFILSSSINKPTYLLLKFELRIPPMMARPRPKTAWIVAKKVTRVATPGTAVHDEEINIEDTPVADNQVIDSNVYSAIMKSSYSCMFRFLM